MFKKVLGIVTVPNMKNAVKFYSEVLGLKPVYEDKDWAEFATDGGHLGLHSGGKKSSRPKPTGFSLYVENIDSLYNSLTQKKVKFTSKPKAVDWGGKTAEFVDPYNNRIHLVEMPSQST